MDKKLLNAVLLQASGWGVRRPIPEGKEEKPFTFSHEGETHELTMDLKQAIAAETGRVFSQLEGVHCQVIALPFNKAVELAKDDPRRTKLLMACATEAMDLLRYIALGESRNLDGPAVEILNRMHGEG